MKPLLQPFYFADFGTSLRARVRISPKSISMASAIRNKVSNVGFRKSRSIRLTIECDDPSVEQLHSWKGRVFRVLPAKVNHIGGNGLSQAVFHTLAIPEKSLDSDVTIVTIPSSLGRTSGKL